MAQERLDHRVYLVGNFELVEVPGADGAATDDVQQPLRYQLWQHARRRCCEMQRRHFAQCRSGLTIELESTPDDGGDVRRRGQHYGHYFLHEMPVGAWQKHAFDPL